MQVRGKPEKLSIPMMTWSRSRSGRYGWGFPLNHARAFVSVGFRVAAVMHVEVGPSSSHYLQGENSGRNPPAGIGMLR